MKAALAAAGILSSFVVLGFGAARAVALPVSTPTVTSVSPAAGGPSGGTVVTVNGTNLSGATAVDFGSNAGTSLTLVSSTSLRVTSPAGSVGTVDVTVTAGGNTSPTSAADHFTYSSAFNAYVTNNNSDSITPISTATNTAGTDIPLSTSPFGVAITPNGATAYVANPDANTVSAISTASNALVATISGLTNPRAIAITPDGAVAYVVNDPVSGSGTVTAISTASNSAVATINVGVAPQAIAVTPDGSTAYVTNFGSGNVTAISTASNSVVATISVSAPAGIAITPDGSAAYVTRFSSNTVTTIDLATNTATSTSISVGTGPIAVAITPNGATAYVVNFTAGTVTPITTATNTPGAAISVGGSSSVGNGASDIAITPDGTTAYATNSDTDNVYPISTASNTVGTAIPVGNRPEGIAITPAPPPTVTGVSPSSGPVADGNSVTVNGTGLFGATAVDFGAVAATIGSCTAASCSVTAPAGVAGTVDVTVTTPGGTSATSSADQYTYFGVPTVSGVSPNAGPAGGGNTVTVSGSHLGGATAVDFGNTPASSFHCTLPSCTVTVPSGFGGLEVDVTVTTPGGTSATSSADRYTYVDAPTVTGVSPSAGASSGGNTVTVSGTNFTGATAVDFGNSAATIIGSCTDTSCSVTAPAGTAGTVDVTVNTVGGTSATSSADDYTYVDAPTVTGVSPSAGPLAGGNTVMVSGTNLTGATAVDFGTNAATIIGSCTATSCSVTAPAGTAGTVDVTVTTVGGTSDTSSADDYTYTLLPVVTGVSPSAGPLAGGNTVAVTGSDLTGATAVDFGNSAATIIGSCTATSCSVTAPAGTAGTVDVTVTTPGGTSATSSADDYTYTPLPVVTGVSPSAGPLAGGNTVTVTGTDLTGATAVDFGTNAATIIGSCTATSCSVTAPAGTAGTVDVTVTTPGGTSTTSSSDDYTYTPVPVVTGVSPSAGPSSGGNNVTVTGSNLTGATAVDFGTNATIIGSCTATSCSVTVPAGTAGTVDVTVTTPGGTSAPSSADRYTYVDAPTVTGVSPSAGPSSGGYTVTVTGTHLGGATAVDFGTTAATIIGSCTATSCSVTAPPGTVGTVDVTVTTVGGTSRTTPADQFTYTGGYWLAASDGGIFAYGDASFFGSTGSIHLNQPIVGMAPTPDGKGYWLVAKDGGILTFGDASFFGSIGAIHLNQPIVGMVATPDGKGYWLVAKDGGIFTFGDAWFFGSTGSIHLNQPIVGMAATPDGKGYWLVAKDGGIFAYGDASFFGSTAAVHLNQPIVGMASTRDGNGYWLVASDGGIFAYGDASFFGSTSGTPLNQPIVGMAPRF